MIYLIIALTLVAWAFANYMMRKQALRRLNERERREEKMEQLIERLKKPHEDTDAEVSDTTGAE